MWTKNSIVEILEQRLKGYEIVVVSEAEPYVHQFTPQGIKMTRAAGGVVTALEPILEVSKGLWIGHGKGSADREVVDKHDKLLCPPKQKKYTLRRLWIFKKDIQGWYFGFSNEMLWPLMHNVFVRPTFNEPDWKAYEKVNRQYADAILAEIKDKKALVWIQDYHLALVPKMLRDARPDILIAQFWHIPWPTSNLFQICPWKEEIIEGMLGSQLLGFHVQSYGLNFLHSVGKTLEAKVDYDNNTVTYKDNVTTVTSVPIGIDYRAVSQSAQKTKTFGKSFIKKHLTSSYKYLALGVERIDYIKVIPERIRAIDRFLEKYPEYQKQFTYLSIAIPTRKLIRRYEDLNKEIELLADKVNFKYGTPNWQPINFINTPMTASELNSYYKSADIMMVTSLADGMNLVAKEYVAAGPKDGVLILSQQTGAAKELEDAISVNPYDIERMADTIKAAIEMPAKEKRDKMKNLRQIVEKNNVYRWAGKFLARLLDLRKDIKKSNSQS